MASRRLAVSAHAPGNEDSPDDTAGVYDDWLMVLLKLGHTVLFEI